MESPVEKQLNELKGSFVNSLKRNNKQIRDDRALAIAEDAEMLFKRKVEDCSTKLKRLRRDLDNLLDLGGTETTKIISPTDFDSKNFVSDNLRIGLAIRDEEIKLQILTDQYNKLFTGSQEEA
jgi:hypothetical protein